MQYPPKKVILGMNVNSNPCVERVHSYISAFLHQPRQSLHQMCDKDDVHDVGEMRRPAGEGH